MRNSKKAAMEMSIGTIVTIVLSVTMLVLGVILIQKITQSATGVVDLNDDFMRDQLTQLYSKSERVVIYPSTNYLAIKQGKTDGVGLGIRNEVTGASGSTTFSYNIEAIPNNCGPDLTKEKALSWIIAGKPDTGIPIASGDVYIIKILFNIPVGEPLCIVTYRVTVKHGTNIYKTVNFNIESKPK